MRAGLVVWFCWVGCVTVPCRKCFAEFVAGFVGGCRFGPVFEILVCGHVLAVRSGARWSLVETGGLGFCVGLLVRNSKAASFAVPWHGDFKQAGGRFPRQFDAVAMVAVDTISLRV